MTADQASPVVARDAGGGHVEALAEAICEAHEPEEDLAPGENFPCHACIGEARVILPAVRALLRAARAEGAREALEPIGDLRLEWRSLPTWGPNERGTHTLDDVDVEGLLADLDAALVRARAASVGRGGVEGDENA